MTFGSRRMTIRNRKHLRKFTPVNTPANMPLGLPKNKLQPSPVQKTQQPPAQIKEYELPAPPPSQQWEQPQVHIQTTEPVTEQPQHTQTQSTPQHWQVQQQHQEPVQTHPLDQHSHVPDYVHEDNRLDTPGTQINLENSVNTSPYHQDISIHQQVPGPDPSPSLRRSERATRGQTRRYDDFVQTILPVCPPSQVPSSYHHYQHPQMMNNQMMTNLMMPNQVMTNQYQYPQVMTNQYQYPRMMSNQMMTNQMMTNQMPMQPSMLWYQ